VATLCPLRFCSLSALIAVPRPATRLLFHPTKSLQYRRRTLGKQTTPAPRGTLTRALRYILVTVWRSRCREDGLKRHTSWLADSKGRHSAKAMRASASPVGAMAVSDRRSAAAGKGIYKRAKQQQQKIRRPHTMT
jgi:hypothetical protein